MCKAEVGGEWRLDGPAARDVVLTEDLVLLRCGAMLSAATSIAMVMLVAVVVFILFIVSVVMLLV